MELDNLKIRPNQKFELPESQGKGEGRNKKKKN